MSVQIKQMINRESLFLIKILNDIVKVEFVLNITYCVSCMQLFIHWFHKRLNTYDNDNFTANAAVIYNNDLLKTGTTDEPGTDG